MKKPNPRRSKNQEENPFFSKIFRPFDLQALLKKPHDKYVKYVLSHHQVALEFLKYALPEDLQKLIDFDSLEPTEDSFIDEAMKEHFSDTSFLLKFLDDSLLRVNFWVEHKSEKPDYPISLQLLKYIVSNYDHDYRQNKKPVPVVTIVLYHGEPDWQKETLDSLFPNLPAACKAYLPNFEFIFINVGQLSNDEILGLNFMLLPKIFLALKLGRNPEQLRQYFDKIVIFASGSTTRAALLNLLLVTLHYLSSVSKINKTEFLKMVQTLPTADSAEALSWFEVELQENFEKGMEKGKEIPILIFMRNNPNWTDHQICHAFQVDLNFVKSIREKLKSLNN